MADRPMQQIMDVVGRALKFCDSIPADGPRASEARFVLETCQDIQRMLTLRVTPGSPEADQLIDLLRQMVEKLAHYLTMMDAKGLALDLLDLVPAAKVGEKFTAGRKRGSGGPVRKAIAQALKKKSGMKNEALWAALSAKPPGGWTFCDNRAGKYIEGPKASDGMTYARFCNIAAEERAKLHR